MSDKHIFSFHMCFFVFFQRSAEKVSSREGGREEGKPSPGQCLITPTEESADFGAKLGPSWAQVDTKIGKIGD